MTTIAELLNQTLNECGFANYQVFATSNEPDAKQIFALANRQVNLLGKDDWQTIKRSYDLLMTSATEYPLPDGYRQFIFDTAFATDQERKADFPVSNETWAYLKARNVATGMTYRVRIADDEIQVHNPRDGESLYLEYLSEYAVNDVNGVPKPRFTADNDTFELNDDLLMMGVKWRFNKLKGLDWELDFQEYQNMHKREMGTDKNAQTVNFADGPPTPPFPPQADLYLPI